MTNRKTLGLVEIPERTIEHDMALLERYTEFSAELLRLGLIGISAIGYVVAKVLLPESVRESVPSANHALLHDESLAVTVALLGFGTCVAAALAHRYFATDSLSWHLQAMRRYLRGESGDLEIANAEFVSRYRRFCWSRYAIGIATVSLGVGAVAAAIGVWQAL